MPDAFVKLVGVHPAYAKMDFYKKITVIFMNITGKDPGWNIRLENQRYRPTHLDGDVAKALPTCISDINNDSDPGVQAERL